MKPLSIFSPPAISNVTRLIIILVICASGAGCRSDGGIDIKIPNIDLTSPKTENLVKLSELADSVWYVPLQTTDSSFIASINLIRITDKYIAVYDKLNKLLVFDTGGNFIKTISRRGKGPYEFITVFSFDIDKSQQNLYAITEGNKILKCNLDKNHIETIGTQMKVLSMNYMADQLIFQIAYPLIHLYQGYSFFSMDCNSLVNEALGNSANISKLRLPKMGSFNENYIYLDTLCCWQFFIDTVYGISANKMITPRYAISYGNKKPGNEAFDNPEMLMSVTEKGTLLLTSLCESKNHFFLELVENRVRQRLLFNKASKSFTRLLGRDKLAHAPVLINDLDLGPDIWPDFVLNGKVMVKILYADELLLWNKALNQENRRCDITELKNITSEDNPVIMFINLK